ncbi:MAG: UTP--glucose-1-phosphate uridylyltransferase GalU [Oscillospiraceae bacterium]|nr:UTP--glucose-1-phosphate uridylyltransferase GalU [Oscillospiraceae bacterium]
MKVKKAVIPAAGLGTRMLPVTKSIPKEMLPIVDKPAIAYIIEEAVASGIEDILIITNRAKSAMEDYFDYAPELEANLLRTGKDELLEIARQPADNANIYYIRQKETLGLGHAVLRAKGFVGDEPFAVLLGDDIMVSQTPVIKQLIDATEKFGASAVGVQEVSLDVISRYCSLEVSPIENSIYKVTDMIEKPTPQQVFSQFAILGRYVLTSDIFPILEKTPPGYGGEIQLTDGLNTLCKQSDMVAVDFEGKRYDTGNLEGYLEATIEFALKDASVNEWLKEFIKNKANGLE